MKSKIENQKSKIKNCWLAALMLFLSACEYETLPTYSGIDNVYFEYASVVGSSSVVDSTYVMFGYDLMPKTDSLIVILVKTLGYVKDYDRPVSFIFEEDRSTAQLGKDVVLYPELSMVPAGSTIGIIAIRVFNNESLNDGASLVAALRIVENEHFKADYTYSEVFRTSPRYRNYDATRYRVRFNNDNERPNMWTPAAYETELTNSFGHYSREKFRLMCEILPGCSWAYFTYGPGQTPKEVWDKNFPIALQTGWSRTLHFYLEYYKEVNGEPLLDENGEEITSGVFVI